MDYYNEIKTSKLEGMLACYNNNLQWYPCDAKGQINAPQPLTLDNITLLANLTKNDAKSIQDSYKTDFIPQNLIHFKIDTCFAIWYTKPQMQAQLFSEALPIENGTYPIPYLLWMLKGDTLSVFALKEEPTSLKTEIYQAPFLNVSSNGQVCLGSASLKKKKKDYSEIIKQCEYAFFYRVFTHTNCDKLLKRNITDVYQEMKIEKKQIFNNELLVSNQTTISDLI